MGISNIFLLMILTSMPVFGQSFINSNGEEIEASFVKKQDKRTVPSFVEKRVTLENNRKLGLSAIRQGFRVDAAVGVSNLISLELGLGHTFVFNRKEL